MGALIPNPMDQEIAFKLNTLFSGDNFKKLCAHRDGGSNKLLFHHSKKLSRIARRIGAYPQSTDATDPQHDSMPGRRNPRARWYHFLEMLEQKHDRTGSSSPTTADAIKAALQSAITSTNPNVVGAVFNFTYTPSNTKLIFLEPNNTNPGHLFQVGTTADHVLSLTLICEVLIPGGAIGHNNNSGANENPVQNLPWPEDNQNQN
jgi:hypothetical protein